MARLETAALERDGKSPMHILVPLMDAQVHSYSDVTFLRLLGETQQKQRVAIFTKGLYSRLFGFAFVPDLRRGLTTTSLRAALPKIVDTLLETATLKLNNSAASTRDVELALAQQKANQEVKAGKMASTLAEYEEKTLELTAVVELLKKSVAMSLQGLPWKVCRILILGRS